MKGFIIPEGYHSYLNLKKTELAIKHVKDFFERDIQKNSKNLLYIIGNGYSLFFRCGKFYIQLCFRQGAVSCQLGKGKA